MYQFKDRLHEIRIKDPRGKFGKVIRKSALFSALIPSQKEPTRTWSVQNSYSEKTMHISAKMNRTIAKRAFHSNY